MVDSRVGYTGGTAASPTYKSVCSGDGHTEALRLEFDPTTLSYEQLMERFFSDPHVPSHPRPGEKAQYRTAVWAQDEEQAEIALRVGTAAGKAVPVLPRTEWHDAEDYHQHFMGEFKDLPDELWDDE